MKVLKHYKTRGGKYSISAILTDNNRIDIIQETNGSEQACSCNNVYLEGIFKFKQRIVEAKTIDGINYCNKIIDLLY